MEKPFLTSAQAAYEPPYAEIIEFTVEGGFSLSSEVDSEGYSTSDGTEMVGYDFTDESWY